MDELLQIAKDMLETREQKVIRVKIEEIEYKLICQIDEISGKIQLIIKER